MRRAHTRRLLVILSGVAILSGCGRETDEAHPRAAVQGKVLLDGQPLPEGLIRFIPQGDTGGPKISANIENGMFSLPETTGPAVGAHRVEIESTDNGGYAWDDEQAIQKLRAQRIRKIERIEVPAVYNRSSSLETVIVAGQVNELAYDLNSRPGHR